MKYEITIKQLDPFTDGEMAARGPGRRDPLDFHMYSDRPYHETRVLNAMVSKEEFEAVKKAIIGEM